jgi:NhaP-type Na+/H+ or K+/H+ antiporter
MASSEEWDATNSISEYLVLFSALLAVVLILSKYLHERPQLASLLPEAGLILLVGMVAGFFVDLLIDDEQIENDDTDDDSVAQSLLSFSPGVFFIALLPPIIFNGGYHLRRELFFRHIYATCAFACIGTVLSAVSIAFMLKLVTNMGLTGGFDPTLTELLAFGALISATDPVSTLAVFQAKRVDPQLFYLVFGESVLNDAVGLVLFKAFANFVSINNQAGTVAVEISKFLLGFTLDAIGSPLLGLLCGGGAALLFKHIDMRKHRLLEQSLYLLIMYVPFLLAELIGLSGIVTILFTGMAARTFVVPNLSAATATNSELLFRLAAHLAESSIFLELGLSVFGLSGSLNARFIMWALLACLIARAVNIYPITFLLNLHIQRTAEEEESDGNDHHQQDQLRPTPAKKNEHQHVLEMSEVGVVSNNAAADDHANNNNEKGDHYKMIDDHDDAHPQEEAGLPPPSFDTLTPKVRQDLKIHSKTAHMLWFSGLRGAVAYACVRSFPDTFGHQREFIITTMVIVLVTVFALGGTTEMVLNHLEIESNVDEDGYMEDWHRQRSSNHRVLAFEAFLHKHFVRSSNTTLDTTSSPNANAKSSIEVSDNDDALIQSAGGYHMHVEITEAEHFDTVVDMGSPPPPSSPTKRRESLFDYGKGGSDDYMM